MATPVNPEEHFPGYDSTFDPARAAMERRAPMRMRVMTRAVQRFIAEHLTLRHELDQIDSAASEAVAQAFRNLEALRDRQSFTRPLQAFMAMAREMVSLIAHPDGPKSIFDERGLYRTLSHLSLAIEQTPRPNDDPVRDAVRCIASFLMERGVRLAAHQIDSPLDQIEQETPVVRLAHLSEQTGNSIYMARDDVLPGGSGKDRVALALVEDAKQKGLLHPGDTIVEATAGSLGYGLLIVCAAKGYGLQMVMPEKIAETKGQGLRMLGAEIITVLGKMDEAMARAIEIGKQDGFFHLDEYNNPVTVEANYHIAGPHLWEAMGGKVDVFIMGRGSGGTLLGIARYLKERNPSLTIISAEPSRKLEGRGNIQAGIGALVPTAWDDELDALIDYTVYVTDEASIAGVHLLSSESVLGGLTSGSNAAIAAHYASTERGRALSILTISPDGFDRNAGTIAGFEQRHVPMATLGRSLHRILRDDPAALLRTSPQGNRILGECLIPTNGT